MKNHLMNANRLSIRSRLVWLFVLIALGSIIFLLFFYQSFSQSLQQEKRAQSRHLSEVGIGVISHFYQRSLSGKISVSQAQRLAMQTLESATYKDNGYFWINSGKGILLMQPYTPDRVGINQIKWTDVNGKFIFQEFVQKAKDGGGWVEYYWPKPNSKKEYPKISYIGYFEPWDWILGTGVYLDDMRKNVFWVVLKATGILVFIFVTFIVIAILIVNYFINQLSELAIRDPLTTLYTKRFLEEVLPSLIKKKKRDKSLLLSAIFIDIDFFKKVNDTYGHTKGDQVLSTVAGMMQDAVRSDDLCIRYGGEEFVIIGFFEHEKSIVDCTERIRSQAEKLTFSHKSKTFSITLSAGIAIYKDDEELFEDTLKRADQMLYKAKGLGRNRIEIEPVNSIQL